MKFQDRMMKALKDNDVFLGLSHYQRLIIADIANRELNIHSVVVPKGTLCNNCKSTDIVPQEPQGDLMCADCWSMDIT